MKKLIILLLFFAALSCSRDNEISTETNSGLPDAQEGLRTLEEIKDIAAEAAELFSEETPTKGLSRSVSSIVPYLPTTKTNSETPFYIVNFDNESGFVIVGADYDSPEVLAYSESGNYNGGQSEIEGFNLYLSEISAAIDDCLARTASIISPAACVSPGVETSTSTKTVQPILEVEWHQGYPFNMFCDGNPAGCVPVAIAQIMSAHSFPDEISLGFPNAPSSSISLNWEEMKKNLHENFHQYDCDYCVQLGSLVREIGERVNTIYRPKGSGTNANNIVEPLRSFGYSCSELLPYNLSTVLANMNKNLPVFIGGITIDNDETTEDKGHGWVVDGSRINTTTRTYYEETNSSGVIQREKVAVENITDSYLHFNYGWGGIYNGYYLVQRRLYGSGDIFVGGKADDIIISSFTDVPGYDKDLRMIVSIDISE